MRMLFFAHSGLRYLVLVAGILALVYLAYSVLTRRGNERTGRILGAAFAGLLDLQILLGILMVVLGLYYSALLGHLFMMVAAAAVAHGAMALARSSPDVARANSIRLLGVLISFALIIGGILAIGRSVFGSGAPSIG